MELGRQEGEWEKGTTLGVMRLTPSNKALHLSCGLICLAPLKPLREAAHAALRLGLASGWVYSLRHTQVNARPLGRPALSSRRHPASRIVGKLWKIEFRP